jgi:hypothetical protein
MSQNYEDFKENYLKTPQHFKDIVKYQVENEVNKSSQEDMKKDMHKNMQKNKQKRMKNAGRKKSHLRWSPVKIAVCACACILAIGGGAYAANQFWTTKGLMYPVADDQAADYIDDKEESIEPQTFPGIPKVMAELYGETNDGIEEATLSIKEVFYDGLSLSVYAEPTEYGKQYKLFNSDRVVVDDVIYMEYMSQNDEGGYIFTVDLAGFDIPTECIAEQPIDIYDQNDKLVGRQYISFNISLDKQTVIKSSEPVKISDGLEASVSKLEITENASFIEIVWKFDERYLESFHCENVEDGNAGIVPYVEDGKGNVYSPKDNEDGAYVLSIATYADGSQVWNDKQFKFTEENGTYYLTAQFLIEGNLKNVDELTITPRYTGYPTEDDTHPQEDLDFAKFTAKLKI